MTEIFKGRHLFIGSFAVIAAVYLILFSILPKESIWISDEGNRIMTVQAYAENGSHALPDPLTGIVRIPPGIRAYPEPYFIQKNGQWRSAYQLFFPWLVSQIYMLLGREGAWLVSVLGGLLTIWSVGMLGRQLFADDKLASLTMALCAFCTPVWFYSGTFLETTCAAFFAVLAVWIFLDSLEKPKGILRRALCGVLIGISILFREEGFIFAAGMGLAMLFWYFSWKRVIAYAAGAALVVIPLLIWNYCDSGSIFGMHHQIYAHLPKGKGAFLTIQLTNYSFYLFLLCLPFWGQLNLIIPWVLLAGMGLRMIPKLQKVTECFYFSVAIVGCGASLWCNLRTQHGGVFIYQSLLDHVPIFALFLLFVPVLLRVKSKEIRFLSLITLVGIFLPPFLLNYDQPGMFWGGRHFLNIVPLLCVLSVFLLFRQENLSRAARTGGWLLLLLSLAANGAGYGVLSAKRNFSAQYVRELAKPEYQVIVTDMFWMPEELAWIHRGKCVLLLTSADSLDQVRPFFRANGIRKFHLLLGKNYRRISNESVVRSMQEIEVTPGMRFQHPMLGFFECQLFECSWKKSAQPKNQ